MKLSRRLTLLLGATMVATIGVSQGVQFWRQTHLLTKSSENNTRRLRKALIENRESVLHAVEFGIKQSMASGDMDAFGKAAALQQKIPGLRELSLYDRRGVITYSSDRARLKYAIDPEIKGRLLSDTNGLDRAAGKYIEVFQPQIVTRGCIECHDDWKEGSISGVLLYRFSTEAIAQAEEEGLASMQELRRGSAMLAGSILFASLVAAGFLAHFATRPLVRKITEVAETLEKGSATVNESAAQTGAASQSLAEGAGEQAASLEETSASLEQMSGMTLRNAENAQKARAAAEQARQSADGGAEQVQSLISVMSSIQHASEDVSAILKDIDEIAFQTNILALNAAVEAARAGAAGAGFAVVAGEVRNLAQRSAEAAHRTAQKIEDCVARSRQGAAASATVAKGLAAIRTQVRDLEALVGDIATASREQSTGISQISSAVLQMDKVTQGNAASAEQCAAAGEELKRQAELLTGSVERLRALVQGAPAKVANFRHVAVTDGNGVPGRFATTTVSFSGRQSAIEPASLTVKHDTMEQSL